MEQQDALKEAITALSHSHTMGKALVGFDGYVDKIKKVIKKRLKDKVEPFPTIADFAARLAYAAGKSAQLELVSETTKLGGNAPIMANSLAKLAFETTCVGTLGTPKIDPVFQDLPATLISLGAPAETIALEFEDGKLILSDVKAFEDLGWEKVKSVMGLPHLERLFAESQLLALVDWSNLPLANDLLQGILREVVPKTAGGNQHFFFDLADPTAKSPAEIMAILETMGSYAAYGKVTLGVNENEALFLYQIYYSDQPKPETLIDLGQAIFAQLSVNELVIHPLDRALYISADHAVEQAGRVVKEPKIQTGAGDNLNAGYCLGIQLNLSPSACLVCGMGNSGAYVSLGHSPSKAELMDYLEKWWTSIKHTSN